MKGIGVGLVIKLILAVLIASAFIGVATIGALGDALKQSFDKVGENTDFTTEIEDRQTLSHLTSFVRDRAMNDGCKIVKQVNEGDTERYPGTGDSAAVIPSYTDKKGYTGLEGTRLTRHPKCFGGQSTIIREGVSGTVDPADPDDNYMPGVLSRERFLIESDVVVDTSIDGRTWLEDNLGGVYEVSPKRHTRNIKRYEESNNPGFLFQQWGALKSVGAAVGERAEAIVPIDASTISGTITATEVTPVQVYFQPSEVSVEDRTEGIVNDLPSNPNPSEIENTNVEGQVYFCEGDEGYIQGSRNYPDNAAFSSKDPLYPVIVVESVEKETC